MNRNWLAKNQRYLAISLAILALFVYWYDWEVKLEHREPESNEVKKEPVKTERKTERNHLDTILQDYDQYVDFEHLSHEQKNLILTMDKFIDSLIDEYNHLSSQLQNFMDRKS